MNTLTQTAEIKDIGHDISVPISVISFTEDNIHLLYAPSLDVYGTGYTVKEAKESFEIGLSEFFAYTIKKRTLKAELLKLGWIIKENKSSVTLRQPSLNEMLIRRPDLKDLMENKNYSHYHKSISIPSFS